MTKLAIYSDFDGVYNVPNGHCGALIEVAPDTLYLRDSSLVSWDNKAVDQIADIVNGNSFLEHIWLTTWNENSNILLAVEAMDFGEGFSSLVEANFDHSAISNRDWTRWKAEAIIEDQRNNPRPYIWIDDKGPTFWSDFIIGNCRAPGLILQPNSKVGLKDEHFRKIESFLAKWSVSSKN